MEVSEMIKRVPIKVNRKPIKLNSNQKIQMKIWEAMEITREDDIYELSQHYNMLMMEVTNKAGYNSLSLSGYTEHKNWIHFESVYEICRMKGWDAKLYLEAQFERSRTWTKFKYPFPNTLYSTKAMKYFMAYLGDIKIKYKQDVAGRKKERGKETKELRSRVIEEIVKSVERVLDFIEANRRMEGEQAKAMAIFNHWEQMSPFYLWSIPWFHDVMKDIDVKKIEDYKREFDRIGSSKSIQRTIEETVQRVEETFRLPGNMQFK